MASVLMDFSLGCVSLDIGQAEIYEAKVDSYEDDFRREDHRMDCPIQK